MQQVADWLEKLGLGQYAQRFAENDISFSVLPDLTDQHLKIHFLRLFPRWISAKHASVRTVGVGQTDPKG